MTWRAISVRPYRVRVSTWMPRNQSPCGGMVRNAGGRLSGRHCAMRRGDMTCARHAEDTCGAIAATTSSVKRRKLKLKAHFKSGSSLFSFKRWNQARFQLGFL